MKETIDVILLLVLIATWIGFIFRKPKFPDHITVTIKLKEPKEPKPKKTKDQKKAEKLIRKTAKYANKTVDYMNDINSDRPMPTTEEIKEDFEEIKKESAMRDFESLKRSFYDDKEDDKEVKFD